ncbi:hypothetical protein LINPERHAP1_LOCUS10554 [Linum perenne]
MCLGDPPNSVFSPLGDGLWLLECSSKLEANRIIALRRQRFGSFNIFLDAWIKEAGRSGVLWDSDSSWVVIRGIPLHLRSSDLARSLGEALGGFLDFSAGFDLSSFRVKVKKRVELSSVILILFGSDSFPVFIEPELGLPVALLNSKDYFHKMKVLKGKDVAVPEVAFDQSEAFSLVG